MWRWLYPLFERIGLRLPTRFDPRLSLAWPQQPVEKRQAIFAANDVLLWYRGRCIVDGLRGRFEYTAVVTQYTKEAMSGLTPLRFAIAVTISNKAQEIDHGRTMTEHPHPRLTLFRDNGDGFERELVVMHKRRLYVITVAAESLDLLERDPVNSFFDSFQVLPDPKSARN